MHVGVARFSSVDGADRAVANAHGRGAAPGWMADAAVVEVHPHGRVVVRGTVAGRYVREQLPEASSAVVAFSDAERVSEMARALEAAANEVVQYALPPEAEAQLRSWVAEAPAATPPDPTERTPQMEDMVITARFTDAGRARRALHQLKRLDDEGRLRVRAGALLERSGQDRITLTGTGGEGAFMPPAGIVGMLIDAVKGPPDTLYARPDEGFYGRGGKPGPDDELVLEEITRNLEPGVTIVIAEIVDPDQDVLDEALGEVGGTVSRRAARDVHAELEAAEQRA